MSRPTRIARLVADRVGGAVNIDIFTEAEFRAFYADGLVDWVDRVIEAVAGGFGHYEEGDEDYLILFFDANALPPR
jgi:hypothetical protein